MTTVEQRVTALERSMATKDDLASMEERIESKAEERHAEHERKAEERHAAVMGGFSRIESIGRSPNY